jgi:putative tryptophan/tyrosine transport system substrate-binding protein
MAKKRKKKTKVSKPEPKYTVGILHSGSKTEPDHKKNIKALKAKVKEAGFGPSLVKWDEDHYPDDDPGKLGDEAKKLGEGLVKKCNVLVASGGTSAMTTLIEARRNYGSLKTPIVFTSVSNPPPANPYLTGVKALTSELDPQRLDIVFELIARPTVATKIVAIKNPRRPNYTNEVKALNDKVADLHMSWGANIDLQIKDLPYSSTIDADIATAFSDFTTQNVRAVVVTADPLYYNRRDVVISSANAAAIPTIYQWRQFAEDEGLISYGSTLKECYTIAGAFVGLILTDMDAHVGQATQTWPIESPTITELVINTTTAAQLPITVPPLLLARAEQIT